jgi:hypothetical protein
MREVEREEGKKIKNKHKGGRDRKHRESKMEAGQKAG